MTSVVKSPLTIEQISVWLRGLLTIAWADGHFDQEEQDLIADLTQSELAPCIELGSLEPVSAQELAAVLGKDPVLAENFLRTAVMVAIADGVYSSSEAETLQQFCEALGQKIDAIEALRHTLWDGESTPPHETALSPAQKKHHLDLLHPVRDWMEQLEIHDPRVARFLCKMIPPQCPFERDVKLFGHKIVHIPPMCKLNPLYDQLVGLRFRALSYLADERGEDISRYC
ncbi:nitrogenase [Ancylothrix sp. C2]|uniref:Mo-dependent nitrogenase C-terminal domain-containing protein n=1 Tax=Ancylothrix sp. D3o TaxID=2953691 RepID=UPI0021BAF15E|nr:Mo-dependent nitrogenase C-terminal domain-containing protein [Ancylothrix sp. D3o]MCT7949147.1 nitrogenase [Ancylothrix sp. D3o]